MRNIAFQIQGPQGHQGTPGTLRDPRDSRGPQGPHGTSGTPGTIQGPQGPQGTQGTPGTPRIPRKETGIRTGVGDPDETAWICYDCATCLCVEDEYLQMPEYALSYLVWLGREYPLLQQHGTLGLRILLSLGRPCFRKLLLGKGHRETRQSGLAGNHILVSQPAADFGDVLPPTSAQLSASFVAIFGQSIDDLEKCQLLLVDRDAYTTLLRERASVNATYANTRVDHELNAYQRHPRADP